MFTVRSPCLSSASRRSSGSSSTVQPSRSATWPSTSMAASMSIDLEIVSRGPT